MTVSCVVTVSLSPVVDQCLVTESYLMKSDGSLKKRSLTKSAVAVAMANDILCQT